jgi:hypothetical protein
MWWGSLTYNNGEIAACGVHFSKHSGTFQPDPLSSNHDSVTSILHSPYAYLSILFMDHDITTSQSAGTQLWFLVSKGEI